MVLTRSSLTLLVSIQCVSQQTQLPRLYVVILLMVLAAFSYDLPISIHWFLFCWTVVYPKNIKPYLISLTLSCLKSYANLIIYSLLVPLDSIDI